MKKGRAGREQVRPAREGYGYDMAEVYRKRIQRSERLRIFFGFVTAMWFLINVGSSGSLSWVLFWIWCVVYLALTVASYADNAMYREEIEKIRKDQADLTWQKVAQEQQAERARQTEKERQAERQRQAEEDSYNKGRYLDHIRSLIRNASESHERLLANLSEMRTLTEQIEADFIERAFAPFWDGICSFAVKMGRLEAEMKLIAQCYQYYEQPTRYLGLSRPEGLKLSPFRRELLTSVDPKMIKQMTDWFRATVRKGQTDFQFASIYEHYRTREVLVEGFRDLVEKFVDISNVLDSVDRSLIKGFRELNACVGDLRESITDEFDYLRACVAAQEERTRQVIKDEGGSNRQFIATTVAVSELLTQKRHQELLASQEAPRDAMHDAQERTLQSIEASEDQEQQRHEDIIAEGKRDRELIEDIDKKIGGNEWRKS